MTPIRLANIRAAAFAGQPVTLSPSEIEHFLASMSPRETRCKAEPRAGFTQWLIEVEQLAAKAYRAKEIAWLREECFAKGMSPAAALDAFEREFGL